MRNSYFVKYGWWGCIVSYIHENDIKFSFIMVLKLIKICDKSMIF